MNAQEAARILAKENDSVVVVGMGNVCKFFRL